MMFINGYIHIKYYINMIARKKSYNSIARSFRSKPSHLIFFSKNGQQIKKLKQNLDRDMQQNIFTITS